jgi:hypothetical protein
MHGFSASGPPPIRRVGIVYPSTNGDPTTADSANRFLSLVNGGMCGSNPSAKGYAYQSDISTAQQQSNTTVAALKNDHITTVIMFGDPIAPVFLTNTEDHNGYHPEQLLAGVGVIDYDVLGQLYNQNAWRYAFGVSVLMNPAPFSQSDAVKAWQDAGNPGQPDATENAYWAYWSLLGSTFQLAGPRVNPGTMQQGLFSAPAAGGTPDNPLIKYGQSIGAYTGLHDARQTFWCATQNSPINGRPGTYVSVDGGRRFQLGQWSGDLNGVFPGGPCAP